MSHWRVIAWLGSAALCGCGDDVHLRLLEPAPSADAADAGPTPPHDAAPDGAVPTPDAGAEPPRLLHRYDFSGDGTVVFDRVGTAHGDVLGGAVLSGSGTLSLDGIDDYVNLPNGLISTLESVTISTWLTWHGGWCWQRVFDFGSSFMGEDVTGYASHSLFVTPATCSTSHLGEVSEQVLLAMLQVGSSADTLVGSAPLPPEIPVHVDLVLDGARRTLSLYVNGSLQAEKSGVTLSLTAVQDVNGWLGRSQWPQDPTLAGTLDEVRIYDAALDREQLVAQHENGPDSP